MSSYPATEAGELVSNNSLFSDSLEFGRAEKPPISADEAENCADEFNDPSYANENDETPNRACGGVTHLYPEDNDAEYTAPAYDDAPPLEEEVFVPEEPAPFMKSRANPAKTIAEWAPIEEFAPAGSAHHDDPSDEFEIATAMRPVKAEKAAAATGGKRAAAAPVADFVNGEPDADGDEEITNCFEEPGLLYRIVNKRTKTWSFYNDSVAFEIHVACTFGAQSKLEALDRTVIRKNAESGEFVAEVVVYPGETEPFVRGFVNGFTSKLRALPLSDEYFTARSAAQQESVITKEMDLVQDIAKAAGADPYDTETVLEACINAGVPFVDMTFPPMQTSIEKGSQRRFKNLPWARPRQYLRDKIHSLKKAAIKEGRCDADGTAAADFDSQVRLFRRPITPGIVDGGELGDCWLQCAVATLSENESAIVNMFRHPRGAAHGQAERRVGAYRVTLNKNGLWRSVVVDDYLPVVGAKLKFAHIRPCGTNDEDMELWPAILQKAYAKLHGSYAAIMSGDPVHALTDLTGAPSYRFDDLFANAAAAPTAAAGVELFDRIEAMSGRQVILTTPGKAPALTPGGGATATYDFSEEPEVAQALSGTGLLPGHAYTVIAVKHFTSEGIRLIQVRNPWPYTDDDNEGSDSNEVAWSEGSPMWQQHASVARECGMTGGNDNTRWFSWADALSFFSGGGVVYHPRTTAAFDARLPITFSDCRPSLMLKLTVKAPTEVTVMLSNMDYRSAGMRGGSSDLDSVADYPPVMLSLAVQSEKWQNTEDGVANRATAGKIADDVFRVCYNTAAEVAAPSKAKWTFLQAREIAMTVTLTPEDGPYFLIPRLMEAEDTVGAKKQNEYAGLDTIHFVNSYAKMSHATITAAAAARRLEIPVTVGVVGGNAPGDIEMHLCTIAAGNSVFENFPKFPTNGDVRASTEDAYFQTKMPNEGFANEYIAPDMS